MDLMKRVVLAALVVGGFAAAGSANAQSPATGSLTVSATVPHHCTVNSPTLSFGTTVNPLSGSDTDATATINVTCTINTPFHVGLGNGANFSNPNRRMRIGATANYLNYEIYRDAPRTERFGDSDDTADRVAGTGLGSGPTAITAYGRIPSGQTTAAVGAYTDTVGISVTY